MTPAIPRDIALNLETALTQGEKEAAIQFTEQAIAQGVSPLALVQEVIVPALTKVGQRFEDLEIFLPELIAAGEAGNACRKSVV